MEILYKVIKLGLFPIKRLKVFTPRDFVKVVHENGMTYTASVIESSEEALLVQRFAHGSLESRISHHSFGAETTCKFYKIVGSGF